MGKFVTKKQQIHEITRVFFYQIKMTYLGGKKMLQEKNGKFWLWQLYNYQ